MKILFAVAACICFTAFLNVPSRAQDRKVTLILVRHAEKETAGMADQADPPLSAAGRERAERLVKKIGKYRPGAFYSTDFRRTREHLGAACGKAEKANKDLRRTQAG